MTANQSQSEPDALDPNWWIYVAIACGVCCLCFVLLLVVLLIRRRRRREEEADSAPAEGVATVKGMSGIARANADTEMVSVEMRSTRASEYARMPDVVNGNSVFYAASSFGDAPGGSSIASAPRGNRTGAGEITYASPNLLSGGASTTPMRVPVVYASGFAGGAQPDYGGAEFVGDAGMAHPAPADAFGHQGAGLLFDNYGTGRPFEFE
jgi:hypothetical protein